MIFIVNMNVVWGPLENVVFSMKTHFYLSNEYKMNIKSSQDFEEVMNNDVYCKY